MAKKRNLTVEERAEMVTLEKKGYRQRAIARKQKISLCAVQEIPKKKEETGTVKDRIRTGRTRVTSKRQDRLLKRLSLSNRKATSKGLKRGFVDSTGTVVCSSTIRRRVLESGLKGCVARKKPLRTNAHKKERLQWCKERNKLDRRTVGEDAVF